MHAFKKTYLSASMSRRYDGPVGDPFGGPAYGEKNMPVVAVVGMYAAGTAFAAAATAGLVGTMIMTGISFVGSALSLVGSLTGNSKLAKIGGIMGLAGGIGALATSNWGAITETFGGSTAIPDSGGASQIMAEAGMENSVTNTIASTTNGLEGGPITGPDLTGSGAGENVLSGDGAAGGIVDRNITSAQADRALAADGIPADGTAAVTAPTSTAAESTTNWTPSGQSTAANPITGAGGQSAANTGIGSTGGPITPVVAPKATSFAEWMEKNKEIIKVGGGVLGEVGKGVSTSSGQKAAAQLQADAQLAAQQGQYDRADELMAKYSASVKALAVQNNINPNANVYASPSGQSGIINRTWVPNNQAKVV